LEKELKRAEATKQEVLRADEARKKKKITETDLDKVKKAMEEFEAQKLKAPRPKPSVKKVSESAEPPKPKPKTKTTAFTYEIPSEVVTDKPETKSVKIKSIPRPTKAKPSERRIEEDDDSAYVLPEYSQPLVTKDPKKLKLARKIQDKLIEDAKLKAQALFKAKTEASQAKLEAKERAIKEAQALAEERKIQKELEKEEERELKRIRKEADEEERKKLEARQKLEAKAEEKRQKIRDAEIARLKALEKAKEEIARQKEAVKERRLETREASEPRGATPSRLAERLERSKTPTRSSSQTRPSPPPKVPQIHQYGIDQVADLEMDFNRLPRKNIYNVVDKDMNKQQTKTIAEDFRDLIAQAKATSNPVVKRGFIMLADAVVNRAYTLSDREGFKTGVKV
jgi:hypothetical protein